MLTNHKYFRRTFYYRLGCLKWLCLPFANPASDFFIDSKYIGPGFNAAHSFSTVVNAESIGAHFTVFQDVTVGFAKSGLPTIGNNVTIFANSVVVGPIKIGDNVTVGACTFINKNIPDNCTVLGNPARIIKKDGQKVNIPL